MGEITQLHPNAGPQYTAPVAISASLDLSQFDCGKAPLNDWLRDRALKSEGRSARTYVVCVGAAIVAYYCLATGAVAHAKAHRKLRQNAPDPVPVLLLGRLAVDSRHQGGGLGSALLKDAMRRAAQAASVVGSAALMLHAIDDEAKAFYLSFGFKEFPQGERSLFLPIETIIKAV